MGETVKVRVAVAIDRMGEWAAAGWSGADDGEAAGSAQTFLETGQIVWIEARVPVPQEMVVEAVVRVREPVEEETP